MRESKCYISVACFHYGGSDLLRFGKFEVLITSQALLSQKQPIFMQNYNFVKNDVFVAKICKYALYESSEGLFCAPRKPAYLCHPGHVGSWLMKGLSSSLHYKFQQRFSVVHSRTVSSLIIINRHLVELQKWLWGHICGPWRKKARGNRLMNFFKLWSRENKQEWIRRETFTDKS